jgi:hypothetical protein
VGFLIDRKFSGEASEEDIKESKKLQKVNKN